MRRSGSLKILEYSSLALPSLRSLATKINTLLAYLLIGGIVGGGAMTVTVTFVVTPAPAQPLVNGKLPLIVVPTPDEGSILMSDAGVAVPPS